MFATERKSLAVPVAIFAAVLMLCAACFAFAGASEAKTFPDQGIDEDLQGTTIEMAPGFSYTYTIMFDETLNEGVEVDDVVNTLPEGTQTTITKQVNGATWGTLKVVLASDCASGQYDLVLKATHADSGQTAYQYIIFDVKSGVTITPTEIQLGNTIQNDVFSKEFVVTAGYGNIQSITVASTAFDVSSQQPSADGTQKSVTFTVSGTPTEIGAKTITISGSTTHAETFSKTYNFTVYSEFEGSFDGETITAIDSTATSSTQETVPSDLNVTWAITSEQVDGVTVDASTGVVTVDSDNYISKDVTVTATDSITGQTKTKTVTVHNEALNPAIQIGEDQYLVEGTFYTYVNAGARTLTVSPTLVADSTFSGIASWDVSGDDSVVTIDNGTVTITAPAAAAASASYTITAETEFGKEMTASFNLVVEGLLSVSEGETVTLINVSPENTKECSFTASAENAVLGYDEDNSNALELTATLDQDGKKVTFNSSTVAKNYTYTLTVSTLGGQTDDIVYTVNTYADLSFDSVPSNGTVAVAM